MSNLEARQKFLELLILLILGDCAKQMSLCHIQKEIFLLWNFSREMQKLYAFSKHLNGPYLDLIDVTVKEPFFFAGYWDYIPPQNNNEISGGFLKITDEGCEKYREVILKIKNSSNVDIQHIYNAITILNRLYADLTPEELSLLINLEFPQYCEKTQSYSKRRSILSGLLDKNIIGHEKYYNLLKQCQSESDLMI